MDVGVQEKKKINNMKQISSKCRFGKIDGNSFSHHFIMNREDLKQASFVTSLPSKCLWFPGCNCL